MCSSMPPRIHSVYAKIEFRRNFMKHDADCKALIQNSQRNSAIKFSRMAPFPSLDRFNHYNAMEESATTKLILTGNDKPFAGNKSTR